MRGVLGRRMGRNEAVRGDGAGGLGCAGAAAEAPFPPSRMLPGLCRHYGGIPADERMQGYGQRWDRCSQGGVPECRPRDMHGRHVTPSRRTRHALM